MSHSQSRSKLAQSYFKSLGWRVYYSSQNKVIDLKDTPFPYLEGFKNSKGLWRWWRGICVNQQKWNYIFDRVDEAMQKSSKHNREFGKWLNGDDSKIAQAQLKVFLGEAHELPLSTLLKPGWLKKAQTWSSDSSCFDGDRWIENLQKHLVFKDKERLSAKLKSAQSSLRPPRI